jgi:hypothetical protein
VESCQSKDAFEFLSIIIVILKLCGRPLTILPLGAPSTDKTFFHYRPIMILSETDFLSFFFF